MNNKICRLEITKSMTKLLLLLIALLVSYSTAYVPVPGRILIARNRVNYNIVAKAEAKDDKGYIIKPRDWFNGLSTDPGASLTDPRAVPPICKEFAEKIKAGGQTTLKETLAMIDEHYDYFEVPFTCGDVENPPNVNTGSAKIFSFALMTGMDEEQTLRLFGEVYKELKPDGDDHQNVRNFAKYGWAKITFGTGLAIISKLQAYDDTDSAMATQSVVEGESEWAVDADSWIP